MRWALVSADAYRAAQKAGIETDQFDPPEILAGFAGWYEDFFELSTDRQFNMGAGPIPAASIDRYVFGWDSDDADMFRHCIRAMDSVYLAHVNKSKSSDGDGAVHATAKEAVRAAFKR